MRRACITDDEEGVNCIFTAVLWNIWTERNQRIFQNKSIPQAPLIGLINKTFPCGLKLSDSNLYIIFSHTYTFFFPLSPVILLFSSKRLGNDLLTFKKKKKKKRDGKAKTCFTKIKSSKMPKIFFLKIKIQQCLKIF
jgi:hypothetical protein